MVESFTKHSYESHWKENDFASFWDHYQLVKQWLNVGPFSSETFRNGGSSTLTTEQHRIEKHDATQCSSSAKLTIDEAAKSGNRECSLKRFNFVGVVLSIQQGVVNFLVYNFTSRRFTHQLHISHESFPPSYPGNWFRICLENELGADELLASLTNTMQIKPTKVLPCMRKISTRVWDNTVNFYAIASLMKKNTSDESNFVSDNIFNYESRFGTLQLTKSELIEEEENTIYFDNSETENAVNGIKEAIAAPEKLKLWCCLDEPQNNMKCDRYRVTRIDARIWISTDTEEDDEAMELIKLVKLSKRVEDLTVERAVYSPAFTASLSASIVGYYESKRLTTKRSDDLHNFVNYLREEIGDKMGTIMKWDLRIFGSAKSGFGTNDCDLDLCLINEGRGNNDPFNEQFRIAWINNLMRILQENGNFSLISPVLSARTPIVKFVHHLTGFHGDISIENRLAIYNTELLKLYTEFDSRVAPLGFAIKCWAKLCGINDASAGYISSYAYIVMLIHFLQRGAEPPVLPFLQEGCNEKEEVEGWNVSFIRYTEPLKYNFNNKQSIAELFRDFLHYYSYKFNPSYDVVQIRTREPYDRTSRQDDCARLRLCVEDPFDLHHNLTSGVATDTLHYVLECFRSALKGLEKIDQRSREKSDELQKMDYENLMRPFKPRRVVHVSKKGQQPMDFTTNKKSNENQGENSKA